MAAVGHAPCWKRSIRLKTFERGSPLSVSPVPVSPRHVSHYPPPHLAQDYRRYDTEYRNINASAIIS